MTAGKKGGVYDANKRKWIVITARVHAGETTGSFMLEGLWRFLFSYSAYIIPRVGGTEQAKIILGLYVVKIFTCLNPDGVIVGNTRTGIEGQDLNRVWQSPDPGLHPTIHAALTAICELKRTREVEAFCDLHTHSDRCGTFTYGCPLPVLHTFAAWSRTHLLPKVVARLTPLFSYKDCSFTIHPSKAT